MRLIQTAAIVTVGLALIGPSGRSPRMSGRADHRSQAREAQDVRLGYVENVRPV